MKRWKKIFRIGGGVIAVLILLVVALTLYVYFHKSTLKNYLERTLAKTPGLTVEIGRLNYRLFPLRMEADAVKLLYAGEMGRADIRIGRAEARGSLTRLIKKQKPIFDSLAVSGMNLEFAEKAEAPSAGPFNLRDFTRGISVHLDEFGRLAVKDSALHMLLPSAGMDISVSGLEFKAEGTDRTAVELTAARLDFRNDKPRGALSADLRGEVSWSRAGPFSLEGTLDLISSSVSLPEKVWEGTGFGLKAGFQADEKSVTVSAFSLDRPGLASLSGSGRASWDETAGAAISAKLKIENIEAAKKAFAPFLPPDFPAFVIEGGMEAEGKAQLTRTSGTMKISVDGTLRLPPARFLMNRNGLSIDQTLQAELRLDGEPDDLHVRGLIEGRQGRVVAGLFEATGLSFRLPVDFAGNRVTIAPLKAQAAELVVPAGLRKLKMSGLSLNGKTDLDIFNRTAEIDSLAVDLPRLGGLTLTGKVSLKPRSRIDLTLLGKNLEIAEIGKYFAAFLPETLTAGRPKGRLDLSLEIRNAAPDFGRYQVKGTGNFSKFTFQNSSGSILSEGLEPRVKFDANILSFSEAIPFSLRFDLAAGESLWEDIYLNWRNDPVRMEIQGTLEPRLGQIRVAAALMNFPPSGEVRVRGSMGFHPSPRFDFHLTAPSIELASLNAFIGRMRPGRPSPWKIQGTAETDLDLRFEAAVSVRGNVKVHQASAAHEGGSLSLAGLEADFPFSISNRFRPAGEEEDYFFAPGRLRIAEIKTPAVVLDPLSVDFYSAENLFLLWPCEIGLWGSRLEVGKSVVSVSPMSLGVSGFSNLSLADLDLSRLPFNTGNFSLTGRASIPSLALEIRPGELRFTGPVLADVFGGRLTLDEIRVTDVFSAGRRFLFQAAIAGLDLKKLTDSVPFGAVTGIVDATIRDGVVSYGQPENFVLTIESVLRTGVARKFSLKAVDNLSIISSAGPSGIPSNNFFLRLVPSFTYSRIGIACSLRNDVFTLQGTVIEKGIQYLVRRSTFFGIDVVNGNPVNKISFKDMLDRMKRVGQSPEKK